MISAPSSFNSSLEFLTHVVGLTKLNSSTLEARIKELELCFQYLCIALSAAAVIAIILIYVF